MKQEKNTVQFSEIRSKGCNDIEMLERFLHGIVETATSKLRQRKLKTTEISIRLVMLNLKTDYHWNLHLALSQQAHL